MFFLKIQFKLIHKNITKQSKLNMQMRKGGIEKTKIHDVKECILKKKLKQKIS